ncbi:MAG: SGNH/GDSL hydrolase family protein [Mesorhizobium sp.]|nr:MAG: SGNH/GDSL hydrolase family protein [Mesorhizobium sp.]TIL48337.1 MAG: SGNH/GDSL hydrolase family protein [Mesorhizobium sp.]TIL55504.1 MAG: SGNH/GDSL hydrolase family protein [Mesorhizobium sp.]TIL93272.1 MAG: SGNH/GDSL hydrolase family protein [Mesorhizobium sp.]TIM15579.1 MAG: SGNH/GDSL hydrolase family protein [Mesorhizobium sp.]
MVKISRRSLLLAAAAGQAVSTVQTVSAEDVAVMNKVVLLGDSVFDNSAYVADGADLLAHVLRQLPIGWLAMLLAVDGSLMADVGRQLNRLPSDATHLVVSVGGNDALGVSSVLNAPSRSVADTLLRLAEIREQFCLEYMSTLDAVLAVGLPTAICSIYDVRYADPEQRRIAVTALSILNDCITRAAAVRGVPLIDLRIVCGEDADFVNAIEPSEQGGKKIAAGIVSFLTKHEFRSGRAELIVR